MMWAKDDFRMESGPACPSGHLGCWPAAGGAGNSNQAEGLASYLPLSLTACCYLLLGFPTNKQPAHQAWSIEWWYFVTWKAFGSHWKPVVGDFEWVGSNFLLSDSQSILSDKIFRWWTSTFKSNTLFCISLYKGLVLEAFLLVCFEHFEGADENKCFSRIATKSL